MPWSSRFLGSAESSKNLDRWNIFFSKQVGISGRNDRAKDLLSFVGENTIIGMQRSLCIMHGCIDGYMKTHARTRTHSLYFCLSNIYAHAHARTQVSEEAFESLQSFSKNQTILVSGDSGSGKTESTKFMMQVLSIYIYMNYACVGVCLCVYVCVCVCMGYIFTPSLWCWL